MLISCITIEGANIVSDRWFKVRIPLEANVLMEGRLFLRSVCGVGSANDRDHALLCNVFEMRQDGGEEIFKMFGEWKTNSNERLMFMFEHDMKICLTKVHTLKKFVDMEVRFSVLAPSTEIWYPEKLTGTITETRQYPPVRLSSGSNSTDVTTALYGNGVYNVTFSSETPSRKARDVFDTDGVSWRPATNAVGQYIQLEVPTPFPLHSFQVTTEVRVSSTNQPGRPKTFKIEGSNDVTFATKTLLNTTNWELYPSGSAIINIEPRVDTAFKYFRLTVTELTGASGFLQFNFPLRFFQGLERIEYGPYPGTGAYATLTSWANSPTTYAFDRTFTTLFTSDTVYSAAGAYTGSAVTTVGVNSYFGEWLEIEFPYPIYIQAFRYWFGRPDLNSVNEAVIVGYSGNVNPFVRSVVWSGNLPNALAGWFVAPLSIPGFYKAFRFIAQSMHGNVSPFSNRFRVEELAFIGSQETMVSTVPQSVQLTYHLQV